MTFFSRAARICIQGLSGGAGDVANAILPILTCVAFIFTVRFIRGVLATALPWRKALAFRPTANCQLPGYRWSGRENPTRSEEHTSELQSRQYLVCRLLLE